MTRAELNRKLLALELSLLSARDLTDPDHVANLRVLLYNPKTERELDENGPSDADLDALATAVEAKLPP